MLPVHADPEKGPALQASKQIQSNPEGKGEEPHDVSVVRVLSSVWFGASKKCTGWRVSNPIYRVNIQAQNNYFLFFLFKKRGKSKVRKVTMGRSGYPWTLSNNLGEGK